MSGTPRFCALVNPVAGGLKGWVAYDNLKKLFASDSYQGEVYLTASDRLDEQAQYAASFDVVLAAGGDGTISAIARHLIGRQARLGVIPLGTANDLSREIGLYRSFPRLHHHAFTEPSLRALLDFYSSAASRQLRLWQLKEDGENGVHITFCNYLSIGYDASVVCDCALARDRWLSQARIRNRLITQYTYVQCALMRLFEGNLVPFTIERLDAAGSVELIQDTRSLFFSNIRSVMGFGVSNPESDGFDDALEVRAISSAFTYFTMLSQFRMPLLPTGRSCGSSSSWALRELPAPIAVQADGDPQPAIRSSQATISPSGTVNVLVVA